jgi:oligoendopeptidase F
MQETLDDIAEIGAANWDLSDLYSGMDDPKIELDIEEIKSCAKSFEKKYRNKINSEDLDADLLYESVSELESISEKTGKLLSFAYLLFAGDTNNPKIGAFLQQMQETATDIRKYLLFFELEWIKVPDETANSLINHKKLIKYNHFLENERKYKPYRLGEEEEKILDIKSNTGSRAFKRLFDEVVNNIEFKVKLDGKTHILTETQTLSLQYDPDRAKRKAGSKGLTKGLKENCRVLTFIFNTLIKDHESTDTLRSFEYPMQSRNMDNEIDKDTVNALLTASENNFHIVAKYYNLKKEILSVDKFYDYDRYCPILENKKTISYNKAKDIVLESFGVFSEDMYEITKQFFDKNWIDSEVREGKRGGAFSHSTVPSVHPYVFTNYNGKMRDVMTLAHELGHGVHQYLSRQQGYFHSDTPLTTSETASVFAEMLVFKKLMDDENDPNEKLALLCGKLEEMFATVFRQVIMTRFEQGIHKASRQKGELSTEDINKLWTKTNRKMFGKSVTLTKDYGYWWLYIPHFVHSPFYCYAYSFGELLVLSLYKMYLKQGSDFVPKYLELLTSGGKDTPNNLLKKLNIDISNPEFWQEGLDYLSDIAGEAETLSTQIKLN